MPDSTIAPTAGRDTATNREIIQQPEIWRQTARYIRDHREEINAFLTPQLSREGLRIIFTGAGTSSFAGEIAAPALARKLSRRIEAIATTDLVSNPANYLAEDIPTLLVSFARSGNSPESGAATGIADQILSDVSHLIITCDPAGDLYRDHSRKPNSLILLMPERSNDEGFAMTSSFTSMLLASLLVFHGDNDSAVESVAAAADSLIASRETIQSLVARDAERIVYIGSGPLTGLARESALKLLELTAGRIVTYFDSALGFRHGPKAVLNDKTLAVVYVSSDPYTRRYDEDIISELRASLGTDRVVTISCKSSSTASELSWVLDDVEGVDDVYLALAYVVFAQLFGLHYSVHLGATPDNPFPGGDVNRVVQGVRIHPLFAGTEQQMGG
ncbi:SIS domain-containing protein [Rhodococcus marinonascens]|uniref:SIS domain-containing protein n=1 Tax=Rhodococcus marinonascens TaxID=38311 RepID=UPI000934D83C|nr:SIS domain-containing protein [Rhodococcus marinonascens]